MQNLPKTIQDIFTQSRESDLYNALVAQLKKDFLLANSALECCDTPSTSDLVRVLQEAVYTLIQEAFSTYVTLLYVVDVPESCLSVLDNSDMVKFSKAVSLLILKREWQKVWFRARGGV